MAQASGLFHLRICRRAMGKSAKATRTPGLDARKHSQQQSKMKSAGVQKKALPPKSPGNGKVNVKQAVDFSAVLDLQTRSRETDRFGFDTLKSHDFSMITVPNYTFRRLPDWIVLCSTLLRSNLHVSEVNKWLALHEYEIGVSFFDSIVAEGIISGVAPGFYSIHRRRTKLRRLKP